MARARKRSRAAAVIQFIETYLVVPDGVLAGTKFKLLPFQKKFIRAVYDNRAGTRRAILSIARKNGKTALIACLVLAHLVGPEARRNAQIVSGALSRDQAAIIYRYARDIANASPAIRDRVRCVDSGKRIVGLKMAAEYRALAAEAKTAHGLSPVLAFLDEVGQVTGPSNDFFDAIVTSQGAHEAPMLVAISTQAPTDGALLSQWIDDAQSGADPRIVCHVYAAEPDAALDSRRAWKAANPALSQFRSVADMEVLAAEAERLPGKENSFRNLFLNQRVSLFDPFVGANLWGANSGAVDDSAFFEGPVYGGLDLSQTTDLTALVLIAKKAGIWHVKSFFWMARDLIEGRAREDRQPYDLWAKQGFLHAAPGKSIDYAVVVQDIIDWTAGMDLQALAFDRYRMDVLRRHMEIEGVSWPLVDWGQGFVSMSPAVDALEIELLHERMRHGDHPVLKMCAQNAVVQRDPAGNRKLDKAKSVGRIDGMVALAMATGVAMSKEVTGPSVYESRGLLVL